MSYANNATYIEIKTMQKEIDDNCTKASKELNDFISQYHSGPMGLTPDFVKAMPEFKELKRNFEVSFEKLRQINQFVSKNFKKELREERKNRYKQLTQ
jgi:hypothetical protein